MIEVRNVTKYYGNFCAVKNVSFSINKGEITGLLGPNGAGKTTTMRMITGFLQPSDGTIEVDTKNVAVYPRDIKRIIGYLPENAPSYQEMLVIDYLRFVAEVHGITSIDRIERIAAQCGLLDMMGRRIDELSKGYRQRVGLAQAMIHDPEILILDEPTSGLDPNQILEVRDLIREIGKTKTVILSTHILQEVEALCERVLIISEGKLVTDSRTSDLQASHGNSYNIKVALTGANFTAVEKAVKGLPGFISVQKSDGDKGHTNCIIATKDNVDARPDIFALVKDNGWVLYEMQRTRHTLENIFAQLTKGGNENE
ncbi:MAG: ATP-binding cassette domain-containing protein [Spirochaetales bacterium]|nr:ATP-binding cassette domain-containing protein [Spirochaetales bacterium]